MARRRKSSDLESLALIIFAGLLLFSLPSYLLSRIHIPLPLLIAITVAVIAVITGLSFLIFKLARRTRRINIAFSQIDTLDGRDFELYVAQLLRDQGYRTQVVGGVNHGDYGADIIAELNGVKTAVQVKRWIGQVGIEAVYQAVGSLKYYGATQAMVVTNSTFTPPAQTLAKANGCELIDRSQLKNWITTSNSPPATMLPT